MEEAEQLSAMLSSTTSLIHHDLSDIDEAQQSASQELVSDINQLLEHCSQTKVWIAHLLLFCFKLAMILCFTVGLDDP